MSSWNRYDYILDSTALEWLTDTLLLTSNRQILNFLCQQTLTVPAECRVPIDMNLLILFENVRLSYAENMKYLRLQMSAYQ
jgi:hypothetical protein